VLLAAPLAAGQMTATFNDNSASIAGATPNASIAVHALMHTVVDGRETVTTFSDIVATDAAGAAHVDQPVAFQSIWVVVDLASGGYIVATPPGYKPLQAVTPPVTFAPGGRTILHPRPFVEAFVARPKVGAWQITASSSRNGEPGAGHGRVLVALQHFTSVRASPNAPDHLAVGDICFVADPDWMRYWIMQIDKNTVPGVANVP